MTFLNTSKTGLVPSLPSSLLSLLSIFLLVPLAIGAEKAERGLLAEVGWEQILDSHMPPDSGFTPWGVAFSPDASELAVGVYAHPKSAPRTFSKSLVAILGTSAPTVVRRMYEIPLAKIPGETLLRWVLNGEALLASHSPLHRAPLHLLDRASGQAKELPLDGYRAKDVFAGTELVLTRYEETGPRTRIALRSLRVEEERTVVFPGYVDFLAITHFAPARLLISESGSQPFEYRISIVDPERHVPPRHWTVYSEGPPDGVFVLDDKAFCLATRDSRNRPDDALLQCFDCAAGDRISALAFDSGGRSPRLPTQGGSLFRVDSAKTIRFPRWLARGLDAPFTTLSEHAFLWDYRTGKAVDNWKLKRLASRYLVPGALTPDGSHLAEATADGITLHRITAR